MEQVVTSRIMQSFAKEHIFAFQKKGEQEPKNFSILGNAKANRKNSLKERCQTKKYTQCAVNKTHISPRKIIFLNLSLDS